MLGLIGLGAYRAVIVFGAALTTACFYHNLILLYPRCDRLVGGIEAARFTYPLGFIILVAGYSILSAAFLLGSQHLVSIGTIVLLVGLAFTVFATRKLFDRILRGATIG